MYSKSASLVLVIIVKREGVFIIKIRVSMVSLFLFYLNDNRPKEGIWALIDVFTCFLAAFNVSFPSLVVSKMSCVYTTFHILIYL
jgi:hypothetical protein